MPFPQDKYAMPPQAMPPQLQQDKYAMPVTQQQVFDQQAAKLVAEHQAVEQMVEQQKRMSARLAHAPAEQPVAVAAPVPEAQRPPRECPPLKQKTAQPPPSSPHTAVHTATPLHEDQAAFAAMAREAAAAPPAVAVAALLRKSGRGLPKPDVRALDLSAQEMIERVEEAHRDTAALLEQREALQEALQSERAQLDALAEKQEELKARTGNMKRQLHARNLRTELDDVADAKRKYMLHTTQMGRGLIAMSSREGFPRQVARHERLGGHVERARRRADKRDKYVMLIAPLVIAFLIMLDYDSLFRKLGL